MVVRQSIAVRPKGSGKQPSLFKELDQWGEYRMSLMITNDQMVMNVLVFHNLIHYLNRNIFNKKGPVEQLRTIRGKYFIIAAQLGKSAGYEVLRLAVRI